MPQPRWIERIYIRAAQRIGNWLAGLCVLLILLPGCGTGLIPIDIGYAQQRAMAEIAIASAQRMQRHRPMRNRLSATSAPTAMTHPARAASAEPVTGMFVIPACCVTVTAGLMIGM